MTATSWVARGASLARSVWRHPANRDRRVAGIARLLMWQISKRVTGRSVVIDFHNRKLRCYPDSTATSAALYFSGYVDYWEMKFLQAYLMPGDGFLDIGANTGVYSILAAGVIGPQGHIDAFEPVEQSARRVEEQALLNGLKNLRVHRFAVSDRNGVLDFGFSANDAMMHMHRAGEDVQGAMQVKSVKLDTYEPYRSYAMGKIDIEGAEPLAFAGAAQRLKQANPPVWLLEFAGYTTHYGVAGHEFVQQLSDAGFDCAVYNPDSRRLEFTTTPWTLGVQNVLAISRGHRESVEQRLQRAHAHKT